MQVQAGILAEETVSARFLAFSVIDDTLLRDSLDRLVQRVDGEQVVLGLGASLVSALGREIPGLYPFPPYSVQGVDVPSTQSALWLWLRGTDGGRLFHLGRELENLLAPALVLDDALDCIQYAGNRDLSGYEDGTENPRGEAAWQAAVVQGFGEGMDGSSFVAVQQWVHDFDMLDSLSSAAQDAIIGRRKRDNRELEDAPASAHIKRTAQEDFTPEAFVLRRSMPWVNGTDAGLHFVAFGKSFAAFEALLTRMTGMDDGIQDALFRFTRPVTGAYYWCPPMNQRRPDLGLLY